MLEGLSMSRLLTITAASLALAALARPAVAADAPATSAPLAAAALKGGTGLAAGEDYRIGPRDTLDVSVFQLNDLNRTVQIDSSGRVTMPLIGAVPAAGKTTAQLATDIQTKLESSYVKHAEVAVAVKDAQSERITVDGAVNAPGIFPLTGPTTLMQAVALAKGPDTHICASGLAMLPGCTRAASSAVTPPLVRAPDGRPLVLTFDEEFTTFRRVRTGHDAEDRDGVWRSVFGDGSKTGRDVRTLASNKERQIYVDPEMTDPAQRPFGFQPYRLHDGILDLIARPASPVEQAALGLPYVSGLITTRGRFAQQYGYFEARVKLPAGKGLWPAVWLLPASGGWPPEIDVMESIGDPTKAFQTIHSNYVPTKKTEVHPADGGFHTYGVAWDAREVVFYLDGVETLRTATPADMRTPMYILANLAVGGVWAGEPDATTRWPAAFSLDYIRMYRFGP